jgi:hypothetical protein
MSALNSSGSYPTTAELMMRAFDKLPPSARAALANSVENWVPQPILTRHNRQYRGYETGVEIVKKIASWDQEELARREIQRRRATGPYAGNAPDALPSRGAKRGRAQQ